MKRHSRSLPVIAAALLLPLGAFAGEATPPAQPTAAEQDVAKADSKADAKAKAHRRAAEECEEATSTRIRRTKEAKCPRSATPTRSYSKAELDSTGQTDVGEALKRLDPRFH